MLGIRPESVGFAPVSSGHGPEVEVEAVERYGDRGDVLLKVVGGEQRLVHRGAAMDLPSEGLKVRLGTAEEGVHLFEAAGAGARIASPGDDED